MGIKIKKMRKLLILVWVIVGIALGLATSSYAGDLPLRDAAEKFITHGINYLLAFKENPEYEKGSGSMRGFDFHLADGTTITLSWESVFWWGSGGYSFELALLIVQPDEDGDGEANVHAIVLSKNGNVDPELREEAINIISDLFQHSGGIAILGKGDKEQEVDLSTPEGMQIFVDALVSSICGSDPIPPLLFEEEKEEHFSSPLSGKNRNWYKDCAGGNCGSPERKKNQDNIPLLPHMGGRKNSSLDRYLQR